MLQPFVGLGWVLRNRLAKGSSPLQNLLARLDWLLFAVLFLLPVTAVLAPNAVVVLFAIAVLARAPGFQRDKGRFARLDPIVLACFALIVVWAGIASFWTYDEPRAFALAGRIGLLLVGGVILCHGATGLTAASRRLAGQVLVWGYLLGLVVLVEERFSDLTLYRLLRDLDAGDFTPISELNRGATALALLLWPVALWTWQRGLRALAIVLPLTVTAMVTGFESASAVTASAAGCLVVLLALLAPRPSAWLLAAVLAAAIVTAPLLAFALFEMGLHQSDELFLTARYRVHIWQFLAERIAEKPLFGWGFDAARNLPNFGVTPFIADREKVVPLHPHNAVLQIWLELGLVGVILLLVLILRLTRLLARLDKPQSAHGQALLLAGFVAAFTSFGLWQNKWFSFLLLLGFVFLVVAEQDAEPETE